MNCVALIHILLIEGMHWAQVQDAMMQGMWVDDVLALPNCAAELGEDEQLAWFGPRVRMGLFDGEPVRVMPHATSGRADYFGPVINR